MLDAVVAVKQDSATQSWTLECSVLTGTDELHHHFREKVPVSMDFKESHTFNSSN